MLYVSVDLSMGVAKRWFIMANRILTWMKFGGTHTLGNHHNYIVVFLFIEPPSACSAGHHGKSYPVRCKQPLQRPSKNMVFV